MEVLKALWCSGIDPRELYVERDEEYTAALRAASSMEQALLSNLPGEFHAAIEDMRNAHLRVESAGEQAAFAFGFRLAVRLLVDGLQIDGV